MFMTNNTIPGCNSEISAFICVLFKNRSIDKVQNLGNERRYIYKDPRQDSGQRNISYTRYPKNCFTQTYRDLHGDAMLVPQVGHLGIFLWVCAARDYKLAPRSEKNSP